MRRFTPIYFWRFICWVSLFLRSLAFLKLAQKQHPKGNCTKKYYFHLIASILYGTLILLRRTSHGRTHGYHHTVCAVRIVGGWSLPSGRMADSPTFVEKRNVAIPTPLSVEQARDPLERIGDADDAGFDLRLAGHNLAILHPLSDRAPKVQGQAPAYGAAPAAPCPMRFIKRCTCDELSTISSWISAISRTIAVERFEGGVVDCRYRLGIPSLLGPSLIGFSSVSRK